MLKDAQISEERTRITVSPIPGSSADALQVGTPGTSPLGSFPVSRCVLDEHPRTSAWAGLAEASQILAEAEIAKGAPLTQAELRVLMVTHLDAYDPHWSFQLRGISEEWMSGWEHAFALAAQQIERSHDPEPLHGIGLVYRAGSAHGAEVDSPAQSAEQQRTTVRFRQATLAVSNLETFWQGVWEGQLAALNEQEVWQARRCGTPARPLSAARCFDELLDLMYEAGNHGLDFSVGYILGYSEGLLCGRTFPPAQMQRAE